MIKKLLLTAIVFLMTFNVCYAEDIISFSEEDYKISYPTGGIVLEGTEVEKGYSVQTFSISNSMSAEEYIRQQLYIHTPTIYLTSYELTLEELSYILAENKDFMIASGYIIYNYVDGETSQLKDRIVTDFSPIYLFDKIEEDIAGRALIDKGIDEYVNEIKSLTDDPLGQLLILHDKLIEDCEYDDEYKYRSYSLYSVFAYKETVCQGYAQAMYFIGRELGLDIELCSSFTIGHIWNYVKLGDKYYHIDATWDDPILIRQNPQLDEDGNVVKDENGDIVIESEERVHRTTALHKNFLMSDETMQSEGTNHGLKNDWMTSMESIPLCDSKKYKGNHFFNIPSDFTTNINNGNYETSLYIQTYTGDKTNKLFYADDLYTGPIITSYPEENDTYYFVYCLITANTNKFNVFVKAHKSGEVTSVARYSKIPVTSAGVETYYPKNSLTGQRILKSDLPQGDNQISVYMWDMETITPLSRAIPIN